MSIIKRSFTRLINSQVKEMEEPRMTLSNNLNGDDLDDIFFYGVDDYQGSASSVRTMQNSVLISAFFCGAFCNGVPNGAWAI